MKKWRSDREYQNTEEKWRQTGEIGYAALEIGRWYGSGAFPNNPPAWALEACRALIEKAQVGIEPVLSKTQGGSPHSKDYARLDYVATEHYNGNKETARNLFRELLRKEGVHSEAEIESSVRRLLNYYGRFSKKDESELANEHVNRVARRVARARGAGRTFGDL